MKKNMKRYQITPEMVSDKAFKNYSNSDLNVWQQSDGYFSLIWGTSETGDLYAANQTIEQVSEIYESLSGTVSVYESNGLPAGEISPEEIEYSNDPAQPTSRCLSDDHWAAEEWAQDAIMPDGRKCQVFYLFSADEIADDDGQRIDADNYPWDADHISRVVIDDIIEISDIIDRAGGQTKFARLHGIPLRTVQNWASGERKPPAWLIKILDKITK